jgi:hypothetical protein
MYPTGGGLSLIRLTNVSVELDASGPDGLSEANLVSLRL